MGPAGEKLSNRVTRGVEAGTAGPTVTTESPTRMRASALATTVKVIRPEASDPEKACTCPVPGETPVMTPL
jgi:hypothetical protein